MRSSELREGDQGEGLVSEEKIPSQGAALVLKEIGLGLGFSCVFLKYAKLPLLVYVFETPIYR